MTDVVLLESLFVAVAVAAFFAGLCAREIMRAVDAWSQRYQDRRRRNRAMPRAVTLNGTGRVIDAWPKRRQRIGVIR